MIIALGLEYDGQGFCGWQTQANGRTVQQTVERALSVVADTEIRVQCAGRTDSGVHASCQVVHMDTPVVRRLHSWMLGANANLPRDVSVIWARAVPDDFHARFSAIGRTYRYIICNRAARSGLWHKKVTCYFRPLDIAAMDEAANYLIGAHDFSSYRAKGCQANNPVRTMRRLEIQRHGDFVSLELEANAFLQHMVRNIAGVLMKIGVGDAEPRWAEWVLQQRAREKGGVTAPPDGLYLAGIQYPDHYRIPGATLDFAPMM